MLNRQTNTNTFYNHRVTLYVRNEPFHSVSLCDYDAYALPTKASQYAQMNSSNALTIVDITFFFSKRKSKEFTQSHAMKHPNLVRLSQTNPVAFRFLNLSHTILLFEFVTYQDSIMQRHLKILSSSPRCNNVFQTTPLVAFRRTDNLSEILVRSKLRTDKQTNVTKGSFRCGKNCITCRYIPDGRTNYTVSRENEGTERDVQGVGRDMSIPLKLFLVLGGNGSLFPQTSA